MLGQYYRINEVTGVSVTLSADGSAVVNACGISIQNKQLDFAKKATGLHAVEELTKHFAAGAVIALNLSGKGILQKQLEKADGINQNNFSKILPNAAIEDFYIQNFISGAQSFVSVIRKADADKWIARLKQAGFIPLMLSLGPFPAWHIIPQLNIYGETVVFDGHHIARNEQAEWTGCYDRQPVSPPFALKIESESIDERLVVPYAAAFQLVMADRINLVHAAVPSLETALAKHTEDKKLKVHGFIALCSFFVLLLANFFLFSWLNSSNSKLTGQVSASAQSSDDLHKINNQVQQKEALLKTLGWEENINKSKLIDQVAALLPAGITWREAAIDPVDLSNSRSQKTIVFFNRRIQISGNSEKIIPVNEWIARIKTKPWVKNAQMDSYTFNSELNTGQFIILIDY